MTRYMRLSLIYVAGSLLSLSMAAQAPAPPVKKITSGVWVTINGQGPFKSGPGGTLARDGYEVSERAAVPDTYRVIIPRTAMNKLDKLAWYNSVPCTGVGDPKRHAVDFVVLANAGSGGRISLKAG